MKITVADIKEYRAMSRKKWNNQKRFSFLATKKSEAIGYAEGVKEPGDTYKDIISAAKGYLDAIQDQ